MSTETNKRLIHLFADGYTKRDRALLREALSPELAKNWIEKSILLNSTYWADDVVEVVDVIAEGDQVWAHVQHNTRHIGMYKDLPPTGKTQSHSVVMMCRVADGRIVQHELVSDQLAEIEQLDGKIVPGGSR
jgi:ketosteroid isomerase-like protein